MLEDSSEADMNDSSFAQELDKIRRLDKNKDWKCKKRQRSIREVVYLVGTWRKLFNGVRDKQGRLIRYRYDDGAAKLGLSKKSCDDYLL